MNALVAPPTLTSTFDRLLAHLKRRFHTPDPDTYSVVASFVVMTFAEKAFSTVPYLLLVGPPASGKTSLAEAICELSFEGVLASSITEAALYRVLAAKRRTLVLDEFDMRSERHAAILKSGYKEGAQVYLAEAGTVAGYPCFGPKVIVSNNPILSEAVSSRTLKVTTTRGLSVPWVSRRELSMEANEIRGALQEVVPPWASQLQAKQLDLVGLLNWPNRLFELASPLAAVAALLDDLQPGPGLCDSIARWVERYARVEREGSLFDAEDKSLAAAVVEFVEANVSTLTRDQNGLLFFPAEDFRAFVARRRFFARPPPTQKLSQLLQLHGLIHARKVLSYQSQTAGRKQRRGFALNVEAAKALLAPHLPGTTCFEGGAR